MQWRQVVVGSGNDFGDVSRESINLLFLVLNKKPVPETMLTKKLSSLDYSVLATCWYPIRSFLLTHWDRVIHICFSKKNVIASDIGCGLFGTKPLSDPILPYCQLDQKEYISVKFYLKCKNLNSGKCTSICRLRNGGHFVSASIC